MLCSAGHFLFVVGLVLGVLAFAMPIYGAQLRKHAETDLADIERRATLGGLRGLAFRLGYPLVWLLYLPARGFWLTLAFAFVLLLPAWVFC
jgi:hypothetical protein